MEYQSVVSSSIVDFGRSLNSVQLGVTNFLPVSVDIRTDEDAMWLNAHSFLSLDPGESGVITLDAQRMFLDTEFSTTNLIVNVEEDFGFNVLESYIVEVRIAQ